MSMPTQRDLGAREPAHLGVVGLEADQRAAVDV